MWNYVPEANLGDAKHIFPMAQDVERHFPDAVVEVDGIKHVDSISIFGILLKGLQEVLEKLDKFDLRLEKMEAQHG